jgi:hypothetical protein
MVKGLDIFIKHFSDYKDSFVLIGGTACDICLETKLLEFRPTKDLDIVLVVEALDSGFCKIFWEFVRNGGYQNKRKGTDKRIYYRFSDPENREYPSMLELFSRKPDILKIPKNQHLIPISSEDEVSSLSAILLDDDYYDFIVSSRIEINGVPVVPAPCLVLLKAKAYLNLKQQRDNGKKIDSGKITRHKHDVFRLYRGLAEQDAITAPITLQNDMHCFLEEILKDPPALKEIGLQHEPLDKIIARLKNIFRLN